MAGAGFGNMLGASSSYFAVSTTATAEDSGSGLGILLIIIIAAGALVGIIIVIAIIVIMRRKKMETEVNAPTPNDIQMMEKDGRMTREVDDSNKVMGPSSKMEKLNQNLVSGQSMKEKLDM